MATGATDYIQTTKTNDFDRNPVQVILSANTAPGAATLGEVVGVSYTVGVGRKARLEFYSAIVSEFNNVALNGRAAASVRMTPSGGVPKYMLTAEMETGEKGTSRVQALGGVGILLAGDKVDTTSQSANNAVGTDVRCNMAVKLLEFDA